MFNGYPDIIYRSCNIRFSNLKLGSFFRLSLARKFCNFEFVGQGLSSASRWDLTLTIKYILKSSKIFAPVILDRPVWQVYSVPSVVEKLFK